MWSGPCYNKIELTCNSDRIRRFVGEVNWLPLRQCFFGGSTWLPYQSLYFPSLQQARRSIFIPRIKASKPSYPVKISHCVPLISGWKSERGNRFRIFLTVCLYFSIWFEICNAHTLLHSYHPYCTTFLLNLSRITSVLNLLHSNSSLVSGNSFGMFLHFLSWPRRLVIVLFGPLFGRPTPKTVCDGVLDWGPIELGCSLPFVSDPNPWLFDVSGQCILKNQIFFLRHLEHFSIMCYLGRSTRAIPLCQKIGLARFWNVTLWDTKTFIQFLLSRCNALSCINNWMSWSHKSNAFVAEHYCMMYILYRRSLQFPDTVSNTVPRSLFSRRQAENVH